MSQVDKQFFKDIVLDPPLPKIFRSGEIYFLKGEVRGALSDVPVTADALLLDSDYQSVTTVITNKGKFSIRLYFESFTQTYEGFKLDVKYYPFVTKRDK